MRKHTPRRQPPIPGGRTPLPATVLHAINKRVKALAVQHRVSRSWVIAVLLADALGIPDQIKYDE